MSIYKNITPKLFIAIINEFLFKRFFSRETLNPVLMTQNCSRDLTMYRTSLWCIFLNKLRLKRYKETNMKNVLDVRENRSDGKKI